MGIIRIVKECVQNSSLNRNNNWHPWAPIVGGTDAVVFNLYICFHSNCVFRIVIVI